MKKIICLMLFYYAPVQALWSQVGFEKLLPWGIDTTCVGYSVLENPNGGYIILSGLSSYLGGNGGNPGFSVSYGNAIQWIDYNGNIEQTRIYNTNGVDCIFWRHAKNFVLSQDGDIIIPYAYINCYIECTLPLGWIVFNNTRAIMRINNISGDIEASKIFLQDSCLQDNYIYGIKTMNNGDFAVLYLSSTQTVNTTYCIETLNSLFEIQEISNYIQDGPSNRILHPFIDNFILALVDTILIFDYNSNLITRIEPPFNSNYYRPMAFKDNYVVYQTFPYSSTTTDKHILKYSLDGTLLFDKIIEPYRDFDKMLITPEGNILAFEDLTLSNDDSILLPLHIMLFDSTMQLLAEKHYGYPYVGIRDMIWTSDGGFMLLGSYDGHLKSTNKTEGRTYILKQFLSDLIPVSTQEPQGGERPTLSISPNPTQQRTTLVAHNAGEHLSYQLYDAKGQLLEDNQHISPIYELSLAAYPSGLYLVKVTDIENGRVMTQKVVKR